MVGTLGEGLAEGSLFTSVKTPPIQGPSSQEEVPRAVHPTLRREVPGQHSYIT